MCVRFMIIVAVAFVMTACATTQPVNELPMYGMKGKSPEMKAADERFVAGAVRIFGSREKGAKEAANRGWQAFYANDLSTAMQRFNQAWLLDEKNPEAYWGFGLVLSKKGEIAQGIAMLEKADALLPNNARIMTDLAHSYSLQGRGYLLSGNASDEALLQKAEELFTQASRFEPGYAVLYVNWAVARYYHRDYKGAWEMVHRARELGAGQLIDGWLLESLKDKTPDPYGK